MDSVGERRLCNISYAACREGAAHMAAHTGRLVRGWLLYGTELTVGVTWEVVLSGHRASTISCIQDCSTDVEKRGYA